MNLNSWGKKPRVDAENYQIRSTFSSAKKMLLACMKTCKSILPLQILV